MIVKLIIMLTILVSFIFIGSRIFKKSITPYNPLTWTLVELSWYVISFVAVCIGLIELERIEKLNDFKEHEKEIIKEYETKRSLLHAQTFLLKLSGELPLKQKEGIRWFHTMKGLFDEGMNTNRWEEFLKFSRGYIFKEPVAYSEPLSMSERYGWPGVLTLSTDSIFLKDEIKWVTDSLYAFKKRKDHVFASRPEENTNYKIRYGLIIIFLIGLSLKILKIYADYRKSQVR